MNEIARTKRKRRGRLQMEHTNNSIVITKQVITSGGIRLVVSPKQPTNRKETAHRISIDAIVEQLIDFNKTSMEHARKERSMRIKSLEKWICKKTNQRSAMTTLKALQNCRASKRCQSPACPVCGAIEKKERLNKHLSMYQNFDHPRFITVIFYHDIFSDISDVHKVLQNAREQLERLLVMSGIDRASGSFEVDYHEEGKLFLPHFHLIVDAGIKEIRMLRQRLTELCADVEYHTTKRSLMAKEIKDPIKTLSYQSKYAWFRVYRFTDKNGKNRNQKARMHSPMFEQSLIIMDSLSFDEINFDINNCNAKPIDS